MKILEFRFCLQSFARQEGYDGGALVVVPKIRMKQSKRDPLGYNVESTTYACTCFLIFLILCNCYNVAWEDTDSHQNQMEL